MCHQLVASEPDALRYASNLHHEGTKHTKKYRNEIYKSKPRLPRVSMRSYQTERKIAAMRFSGSIPDLILRAFVSFVVERFRQSVFDLHSSPITHHSVLSG
jgi:hypothetical protein